MENMLSTWNHFVCGKRNRRDVLSFQAVLSDNLVKLFQELKDCTYEHGSYIAFNISDPKPRIIHKASVRDRMVHHLIYKELYWYFDNRFIHDSYSCRKYKGTHKALDRFKEFAGKVSKNHTRTCYVLKCDIKKFFASIDHMTLLKILKRHIVDPDILWLINQIMKSFHTTREGVGLPLGNLTSQLLVNIYMHEFDMFVKQELRIKYYIRYADDFVLLSDTREELEKILEKIEGFLKQKLKLNLHEHKVSVTTYASGVDFLGWVHFPHHRTLRSTSKRKMFKKLVGYPKPETVNSYRGILSHGNTYKLKQRIKLQTGCDILVS